MRDSFENPIPENLEVKMKKFGGKKELNLELFG